MYRKLVTISFSFADELPAVNQQNFIQYIVSICVHIFTAGSKYASERFRYKYYFFPQLMTCAKRNSMILIN